MKEICLTETEGKEEEKIGKTEPTHSQQSMYTKVGQ